MSKVIKNFTKNFTIADNRVAQCEELDLNAKGLYLYIASLPDDWEFSIERIARANQTTEGKVKSAIEQLERVGLLKRHYELNTNGKRGVRADYEIFDFDTKIENSSTEISTPKNSSVENLGVYKNNNITKKESHKKSILQTPYIPQSEIQEEVQEELPLKGKKNKIEYTPEFESFYGAYPRQINKAVAFNVWKRVIKTQSVEVLIAKAKEYAEYCVANQTLDTYIAHPSTWLNRNYFENDYKSMMPHGYKQRQAVMQRGLSDWGSNDDDNEFF